MFQECLHKQLKALHVPIRLTFRQELVGLALEYNMFMLEGIFTEAQMLLKISTLVE